MPGRGPPAIARSAESMGGLWRLAADRRYQEPGGS